MALRATRHLAGKYNALMSANHSSIARQHAPRRHLPVKDPTSDRINLKIVSAKALVQLHVETLTIQLHHVMFFIMSGPTLMPSSDYHILTTPSYRIYPPIQGSTPSCGNPQCHCGTTRVIQNVPWTSCISLLGQAGCSCKPGEFKRIC